MFRRTLIAGSCAGTAWAQDRPVRLIAPFAAGGVPDLFARRLAHRMQAPLGQPVSVENRPGPAGSLEAVRARPDGQTILFGTASTLCIYPMVVDRPLFDPLADLAPVSVVGAATVAFAVRADGAADLARLVAAARARPGALRFASPGRGTFLHLAMELLKREAGGIDLPHIAPDGTRAAIAELLDGRVDAVCDTVATALDEHRAGRIRILAVASARRSPLLPEVPTVAEALRLPGFEAAVWMAVMLPLGVPPTMRDRLAYAINSTMADAPMRATLERDGFEAGALLSTPEIGPFMRAEQAKWRPLVEASGARLE